MRMTSLRGDRRALGGALHLDDRAGARRDEVQVDLGARVLEVDEVEREAVVEVADARGGDGLADARAP